MNLLLHPLSQNRYEALVNDPPQSLLILAPAGSGKSTILNQLAADILGEHAAGRLFEILPEEGKKSISIDAIRELKKTLRLKSEQPRVIVINQAGTLTLEAQNSILKLLEDTPKNVHFFMSVNNASDILDTIISRSVLWSLIMPTKQQITKYFTNTSPANLEKTILIAENRVGLICALLDNNSEHPLIKAIDNAKTILGETQYNRLLRVEILYKDRDSVELLLEALQLVCKAALDNAALKHSNHVKSWQQRLSSVLDATKQIQQNIQPKLVLTRLFVML